MSDAKFATTFLPHASFVRTNDFERYAVDEEEGSFPGSEEGDRAPFSLADILVPNELVKAMRVRKLIAPRLPLQLLTHHFAVVAPLDELVENISKILEEGNISFEFREHDCVFKGVFVHGSAYVDFRFRVFSDDDDGNKYVIEGHMTSKDSCRSTFQRIWSALRSALLAEEVEESGLLRATVERARPIDAAAKVQHTLDIISSGIVQQELEGARLLCDLCFDGKYREALLQHPDVMGTLDRNLGDPFFHLSQLAASSLAQLTKTQEADDQILVTTIPETLVALAREGSYESVVWRRDSAAALANIAGRRPGEIVEIIGKEKLHAWLESVQEMQDSVLKEHCVRVVEAVWKPCEH